MINHQFLLFACTKLSMPIVNSQEPKIAPLLANSHFFPDDIPGQMRTRRAQCGRGRLAGRKGRKEGRIMGHIYVMSQLAERSNGIAAGRGRRLAAGWI